jgi:phospholipase C
MRALYRRKSKAFTFTMLGPRVPALVISPYVDAGTISTDVRDHASVPATLRALFAAQAAPLTSRDAWAKPFHIILNRTTPRPDLPDLSGHIATPAAVIASPTTSEAPTALGTHVPHHYEPFVQLADDVHRTLVTRNADVHPPVAGAPALERAKVATDAFGAHAERIRQGPPPT